MLWSVLVTTLAEKNAGVAFPLPVVWPCPLLRRRESSLRVVVAGAQLFGLVPYSAGEKARCALW